jgi:hypothetical protein
MHPLPPHDQGLRTDPNGTLAIVTAKKNNCPHSRRKGHLILNKRPPAPPLIYWPPIALTGVVCLALVSTGVLLAMGVGKRQAAQTKEPNNDESPAVVVEPRLADSPLIGDPQVVDPLDDNAGVVTPPGSGVSRDPAPIVEATPLNPQTLDPFADAAGDIPDPAQSIAPPKAATTCKRYGTAVDFVDNPIDAASQALREKKLLFVLHVAGNFEEEKFT